MLKYILDKLVLRFCAQVLANWMHNEKLAEHVFLEIDFNARSVTGIKTKGGGFKFGLVLRQSQLCWVEIVNFVVFLGAD